MHIRKIKITNFKCFRETFEMDFEPGLNIIVGNNEAGKSTIIEAIHLTLTGLYNGKYLRNELSEYLFNYECLKEFKSNPASEPPEIKIELFFEGDNLSQFEGDNNSDRSKNSGVILKIGLDENDRELYNNYIQNCGDNVSLPIEYFEITWSTFAREYTSTKHFPIKSALIDSNSHKYQNGSDVYISHIIKTHLDTDHKNGLIQAHRRLQDKFVQDDAVKNVNKIIEDATTNDEISANIKLHIDLSSKSAWENNVLTHVGNIPFHHIGKGQQSIIKTRLALAHKKSQEANVIMIEEPENHLSHSRLNKLIKEISVECGKNNKQVIITTHSSFVANKLGLDKLILLSKQKKLRLRDLDLSTINFFRKISGYDTLRLILCDAAILCEGDSDELIIQKKYLKMNARLPIDAGIEVISVGLSFQRYIDIGEKLGKRLAIVTDNDGKHGALIERYKVYNNDPQSLVKVFFDNDNEYPTLEPQLLKNNDWNEINEIVGEKYLKETGGRAKGSFKCITEKELLNYMLNNKTECALKLFDTNKDFVFPSYIEKALSHAENK